MGKEEEGERWFGQECQEWEREQEGQRKVGWAE